MTKVEQEVCIESRKERFLYEYKLIRIGMVSDNPAPTHPGEVLLLTTNTGKMGMIFDLHKHSPALTFAGVTKCQAILFANKL